MGGRILVTGATGFLGPHVVAALATRGDAVWALARRAAGDARIAWTIGDLLDELSLRRALAEARPDLVIHLAGRRAGTRADLEALHVGGIERLLAAVAAVAGDARAAAPRVVVAGSAAEYGAAPEAALPLREEAPLVPIGDYGATKALASARALAIGAAHHVPVVVARVFNVTGPGEPESLLFGRVAAGIARAERLAGAAEVAVGPLGATRDLIDVRDVARALLAIADGAAPGAIVNVGRGVEEPVRAHAARLVAGARVPVRLAEPPGATPPPPLRHVADVTRLAALGFRPAIPLEASARDLLADARARVMSCRLPRLSPLSPPHRPPQ